MSLRRRWPFGWGREGISKRKGFRADVETLEGRSVLAPAAAIPGGVAGLVTALAAPAAGVLVPLFNGRNLAGFRIGDEVLGPVKQSPDGRFAVRRGVLVVNPGQGIDELYRTREFNRDFTLAMQFRAAPGADSGVFIRGVQLQVRDYPRVGPYTGLQRFQDGGWNRLVIRVRSDGLGGATATCTCNGEVLEQALRVPATGSIGFQAESGLFEYRRIRIRFDSRG